MHQQQCYELEQGSRLGETRHQGRLRPRAGVRCSSSAGAHFLSCWCPWLYVCFWCTAAVRCVQVCFFTSLSHFNLIIFWKNYMGKSSRPVCLLFRAKIEKHCMVNWQYIAETAFLCLLWKLLHGKFGSPFFYCLAFTLGFLKRVRGVVWWDG